MAPNRLAHIHTKKLREAVWYIIAESGDEKADVGTGFAVKKYKIVTAFHVIRGNIGKIYAQNITGGPRYRMSCYYKNRKWDIAELSFQEDVIPEIFDTVPLAALGYDLPVSADIGHIGNSGGVSGGFQTGRVAFPLTEIERKDLNLNACRNQYRPYRMNYSADYLHPAIAVEGMTCAKGSSGGPILNSKGRVVGMLTYSQCNYTLGLHLSAIRSFVDKRPVDNRPGDGREKKRRRRSEEKGGREKKRRRRSEEKGGREKKRRRRSKEKDTPNQ